MKHVVGVADMRVSAAKADSLITYALGSCLGIVVYDPMACVGGMLHVMLPLSTSNPQRAAENPYTFVDTGVPRLFLECYKLGARKERLVVKAAGGACTSSGPAEDYFQIGKRNVVMLRKILWKNSVSLNSHDLGGTQSRTMSLDLGNGDVVLKINGAACVL